MPTRKSSGLAPDIYAVNEDGDKGGKREYCAQRGIEYLVLKRLPAPGLPGRSEHGLEGVLSPVLTAAIIPLQTGAHEN